MDFKRLAGKTLNIVVALGIIIIIISNPKSAIASEKTDVVVVVHQFFDNLDEKKLQTAFADWWKGLKAYDEKSGITDGVATLGTLWTVDVTGDRAYFVAPAVYTYKQHGKLVKEARCFYRSAAADRCRLVDHRLDMVEALVHRPVSPL